MFVKIPDYDNVPEPESGGDGRPSLYWLVFLILLSSRIWWKAPGLDMSGVWTAANIRIGIEAVAIATGWTAFLALVNVYIWPAFLDWWKAGTAAGQQQVAAADPPPQINGERPQRVEATVSPGQTRVIISNRLINLAEYGVEPDHWQRVKQARQGGNLPDVSLPKLEALGIDRKHRASEGDSDAHRIIEMLLDLELIVDGGDRRPYVWSADGETALPCPRMMRVH